MTTLTALKLERELQIARAALAAGAPKLSLRWTVCPETGRAKGAWVQDEPDAGGLAAVLPYPALA